MDPNQAFHRGIKSADVQVTCHSEFHRGDWLCWIADATKVRGQRILFSGSVYATCDWRADLRDMEKRHIDTAGQDN